MTDFPADSILVLLEATPTGELATSAAGLLAAASQVGTPVALAVTTPGRAQALAEQAAEGELDDDERAAHRDLEEEAEVSVAGADVGDHGVCTGGQDVDQAAHGLPVAAAVEPAGGEVLREGPDVDAGRLLEVVIDRLAQGEGDQVEGLARGDAPHDRIARKAAVAGYLQEALAVLPPGGGTGGAHHLGQ